MLVDNPESTYAGDCVLLQSTPPSKKQQDFYSFDPVPRTNFTFIAGEDSHVRRRQLILKAHPDIAKLMKSNSLLSHCLTLLFVTTQLSIAHLLRNASWPMFLAVTYIFGGAIAHASHILIHDFTHFAGGQSPNMCQLFAILNNLCTGIPSAISYGNYHADHHNFNGEYRKDSGLPTELELRYVNTRARKALWIFFFGIISSFRPVLFYDKPKMTREQLANILFIAASDLLIYKFMGPSAIAYLFICAFLSYGPHPTAFHNFTEHYEYVSKMETYDYTGPMNFFGLNIGYHIEHHDFPSVPWYNLPKVRVTAPQFYEQYPRHTSYMKMIYKFIMDDNFGLYHRIVRISSKQTA